MPRIAGVLSEGSISDQISKLAVGESFSRVAQIEDLDKGTIDATVDSLRKNTATPLRRAIQSSGQEYVTDSGVVMMASRCVYAVYIVTRVA